MTEDRRRITFMAVGLLYGMVMTLWAAMTSGGGHFRLLLIAFISPYGLGLFFWPLWGALVAGPTSRWMRTAFFMTMAAHYGGLLHYMFMANTDDAYWYEIGAREPGFEQVMGATLAVYAAGQVFLWVRFLRSFRTRAVSHPGA